MLTISFFNKKKNRILAQALFWACLLGAMNLMFVGMKLPPSFLLRNIFTVMSAIVLILLNTYFFVPRFFYKKQYGAFIMAVSVGLLGMTLLGAALEFWVMKDVQVPTPSISRLYGAPIIRPPSMVFSPRYFMGLVINTAVVMVSTVLESVQLHRQQEQVASQITNEKLATELKFLKSQINPHFLFNVLNNVYTLSIIKSEQTPDVVMKLSEMLRYMLYQSGYKWATLEQEIAYIQNYIALQQLKDDEPLSVELEIAVQNPLAQIAPMLLIPFVENAFKHSKIEDTRHGWIKIGISEIDNHLDFWANNSLPVGEFTKDATGGIGLSNVHRRLELEYPEKHALDISQEAQSFHVHLKMDLHD